MGEVEKPGHNDSIRSLSKKLRMVLEIELGGKREGSKAAHLRSKMIFWVKSISTHSSWTSFRRCTHHSIISCPSAVSGPSLELMKCRILGGQTDSQNSALMASECGMGPPAVGPDINAFRGILTGRNAKS